MVVNGSEKCLANTDISGDWRTWFVCLSFFQSSKLLSPLFTPKMTHTVPLKNMDFRLDIKICVKPFLRTSILKQLGYIIYESPATYAVGARSREAMTLVDWGGHNNNLGVVSSAKEVLEAARKNLTNILHSVSIDVLFHLKKPCCQCQSWGTTDPSIEMRYKSSTFILIREGFQ